MKFFFFSFDIYPFFDRFRTSQIVGGAEKQQYLVINELRKLGHEIVICTNLERGQEYSGIKFEAFSKKGRFFKYIKLFICLILKNPDVVYLRSPSNFGIVLSLYSFLFRKKFLFFSAHDTDFDEKVNMQGYVPILFYFTIKLSKYIFVQNEKQNFLLKKNFGRSGIKIGNLIEKNYKINQNFWIREYFIWVGRIEPFKRLELLFQLSKILTEEKFVVIGSVNYKSEYTSKCVEKIKSIPNIKYYEFISPYEINTFYQKARGLICTSLYEGFSNTFLEAFNNGTPVYTFGVDPDKIIIQSEGRLGWVFNDIEEFKNKIYNTLEKADYNYMIKYLDKHHSIEKNVRKLVHLVK
jgi:glycosyltransferase involved in cell wall biosynthesis